MRQCGNSPPQPLQPSHKLKARPPQHRKLQPYRMHPSQSQALTDQSLSSGVKPEHLEVLERPVRSLDGRLLLRLQRSLTGLSWVGVNGLPPAPDQPLLGLFVMRHRERQVLRVVRLLPAELQQREYLRVQAV